jgi:hypothetical protein
VPAIRASASGTLSNGQLTAIAPTHAYAAAPVTNQAAYGENLDEARARKDARIEATAKTIMSGAANLLSTVSAVPAAKNRLWASEDLEIHGHQAIVSAPCANKSAVETKSLIPVFEPLRASFSIHYCVPSPGKLSH